LFQSFKSSPDDLVVTYKHSCIDYIDIRRWIDAENYDQVEALYQEGESSDQTAMFQ